MKNFSNRAKVKKDAQGWFRERLHVRTLLQINRISDAEAIQQPQVADDEMSRVEFKNISISTLKAINTV